MPAKDKTTSMRVRFRHALGRAARFGAHQERRGTIIVLALAVLAVLALAAVSYVSVVGLDRRSSGAIARVRDYQQQPKAVLGHIQALIAADLFGNKIVTADVPRFTSNGQRVWPTMFEDGETWDVPHVEREWREVSSLSANPLELLPRNINTDRGQDPGPGPAGRSTVARPDDAWLASSEPEWDFANINQTDRWRQITNPRSAWTWNTEEEVWQRDDGKFVSLAAYFDAPNLRDDRPDMGLDILNIDSGQHPTLLPEAGIDDRTSTSLTAVFADQLAELYNEGGVAFGDRLTAADEAEWADTDGDLRADARWTKIDALGDLYGLNWFVAMRITDASALINFNASLEAPSNALATWSSTTSASGVVDPVDVAPDGLTPADIDLYRLLTFDYGVEAPGLGTFGEVVDLINLRGQAAGRSFADHVEEGLNVPAVIAELQGPSYPDELRVGKMLTGDATYNDNVYRDWAAFEALTAYEPLTSAQRRAWYEWAGSTPREAVIPVATAYPVRELLDLRAFWGTNNESIVSKFEQYIDGPEVDGFLPGGADVNFGPLRARERGTLARSLGQDRPSLWGIHLDNRRQITPVSGESNISPVPPINDADNNKFEEVTFNTKVSLPRLKAAADDDTIDDTDARRVFESFMWALAPLSFDTAQGPDMPSAVSNPDVRRQQYHYGGAFAADNFGASGYARALGAADGQDINSAYALMRAGALTVNLIDAMDQESGTTPSLQEVPTVLRFYPEATNSFTHPANTGELRVNARLINGDLSIAQDFAAGGTIQTYVGGGSAGNPAGVSFVGLDRQPFLREVHFFGAYQHFDDTAAYQIDTTDVTHQCGSAIAIELGNPWPDAIDVANYAVRIQNDAGKVIEISLDAVLNGSTQIDAGANKVFVWRSNEGSHDVTNSVNRAYMQLWAIQSSGRPEKGIYEHWLDEVVAVAGPVTELEHDLASMTLTGTFISNTIPFAEFAGTNLDSVQLVLAPPLGSAILVDRLSLPFASRAFPYNPGVITDTAPDSIPGLNEARLIRATVNANLTRPTESAGGFPSYVIERAEENSGLMAALPDTDGHPQMQAFTLEIATVDYLTVSLETDGEFLELADPPAPDDSRRLGQDKGALTVNPAQFQLFVPDRRLDFRADLGMLSAFCTMFVHGTTGPADVGFANVSPLGGTAPTLPYWITFSEQMGLASEMFLSGSTPNPYWGVINPVDFVLGDGTAGMGEPYPGYNFHEALKVPLGTRIYEPFQVLDPKNGTGFVEGRINANTMSLRVAEALSPILHPSEASSQFDIQELGGGATPPLTSTTTNRLQRRPQLLLDYRDARMDNLREVETGLPIRRLGFDNLEAPGFVTPGELSILAKWDRATLAPNQAMPVPAAGGNRQTMLDLANDFANTSGMPFEWWSNGNPALTAYAPIDDIPDGIPDFNPQDDPEERLALFRSISNLVSTRSDVFLATFIVRGYDPDQVESIKEPPPGGGGFAPEDSSPALRYMSQDGDEAFEPAYEGRFLAVLDRSNVRLPTDRPEVLLFVELPAAQ